MGLDVHRQRGEFKALLRRCGNGGNLVSARTGEFRYDVDGSFLKVPEGYIGFVEELPGANTQGKTLQEARDNIREAIELTFEANGILGGAETSGTKSVHRGQDL